MRGLSQRIKRLEGELLVSPVQDIQLLENHSFIIASNAKYFYQPYPTLIKLHESDATYKVVMGPYGSGKSSGMMAEIVLRACAMPKDSDGIRYAKWAIIRNTYGDLLRTSYQTWLKWFGALGKVNKRKDPHIEINHVFNDGEGEIHLDVIFLALSSEDSISKLQSLEVTGAYINEMWEVVRVVFDHLKARIHRYPALNESQPDYPSFIIADTNPPKEGSWIQKTFPSEECEGHIMFRQPPGLISDGPGEWIDNPDAENVGRDKNGRQLGQASDYYSNFARGQTEEFIKVYCLGEYGTVLSGKKVFPEYNDDLHSKSGLVYDNTRPIYMGWDFGLTPTCVILQEQIGGQIVVLDCLTTDRSGLEQFLDNIYVPFMARHYPNAIIAEAKGDPAGSAAQQANFVSNFDIFKKYGMMVEPSSTNILKPRLEVVRNYLRRLVDAGQPAIVFRREGCEPIIDGFRGGYHYKKINLLGEEIYREEPNKNEYSHPQDALQYILLAMRDLQQYANLPPVSFRGRAMRF